jgi:preprotein translocase subunit Sec63
MTLPEVENDSVNQYTKRPLTPRLAFWWRRAYDLRTRQGVAEATIDTFLQTKSLTTTEITSILSFIED